MQTNGLIPFNTTSLSMSNNQLVYYDIQEKQKYPKTKVAIRHYSELKQATFVDTGVTRGLVSQILEACCLIALM
jgi:hypothetical protein